MVGRTSLAIEQIVDQYVRTRRDRTRALSMATAVRAIRFVLPDLALSDREIADLVAGNAIERGFMIEFDQGGAETIIRPRH